MSDDVKGNSKLHLDDDDLSTIAAIACNFQSGRITKFEIAELIRVYRQHAALVECAKALEIAEAILSNSPEFSTTNGGRIPVTKVSEARDIARDALSSLRKARGTE